MEIIASGVKDPVFGKIYLVKSIRKQRMKNLMQSNAMEHVLFSKCINNVQFL